VAFLVTKIWNNGYRCCCHSTYDGGPEWFKTEEEALALFPLTRERVAELCGSGDSELEQIEVHDGTVGEPIAEGKLEWTSAKRGQGYSHWRFAGHVRGEPFEFVFGNREGESWDEMKARLRREVQEES
jgi:hypothetical protein